MKLLDGKAEIGGIEVELLAEVGHLLPDGTWTVLADFSQKLWLEWHGQSVAVFPLELEEKAYESTGRPEKAAVIREQDPKCRRKTKEAGCLNRSSLPIT